MISDIALLDLKPLAVEGNFGDRGDPCEGFWRAVGEVVEDE